MSSDSCDRCLISSSSSAILKIKETTSEDVEPEEPVVPMATRHKEYVRGKKQVVFSAADSVGDNTKITVVAKNEETKAKIKQIIESNFLFSRLDGEQKQTIIDAMFEADKKAGEVIMKQGDVGDNFYVIDHGVVDVIISPGKGKPGVSVSHLSDGQGFGELALISSSTRAATIQAITDVSLWAMDRNTYRCVMMNTITSKRTKYQNFIKNVPFLSSLQPYEINSLCDALIPLEYEANTIVITEGEPGSRFYIIEEGEVVVTRKVLSTIAAPIAAAANSMTGTAELEVNRLKSSQYFGEIALLTPNAKRMATIQTLTKAKFLALDGMAFNRLLGPIEPILKRNMQAYKIFMKK